MPRSPSGRLVIDLTPYEKQQLYIALARDNLTLKEWFRRQLADYLEVGPQETLFPPDDSGFTSSAEDEKEQK